MRQLYEPVVVAMGVDDDNIAGVIQRVAPVIVRHFGERGVDLLGEQARGTYLAANTKEARRKRRGVSPENLPGISFRVDRNEYPLELIGKFTAHGTDGCIRLAHFRHADGADIRAMGETKENEGPLAVEAFAVIWRAGVVLQFEGRNVPRTRHQKHTLFPQLIYRKLRRAHNAVHVQSDYRHDEADAKRYSTAYSAHADNFSKVYTGPLERASTIR